MNVSDRVRVLGVPERCGIPLRIGDIGIVTDREHTDELISARFQYGEVFIERRNLELVDVDDDNIQHYAYHSTRADSFRRRDDISPRLTWEDMHIQVFVAQRLSSAKVRAVIARLHGAQNTDWTARVEQYRRLVRLSNCTDAAVMLLAVSVDRG